MKVTILGCGTSGGVPRIGNEWGACDPHEPRNRRRRASILVEEGGTRLLVDTSPDLRLQLLDAGVSELDAVLYTHDHADHAHGIDELRVLLIRRRAPIPAYTDAGTYASLKRRFGYAFEDGNRFYPPMLEAHEISGPFRAGAIDVVPFEQDHGGGQTSLGFRFGPIAYSTDVIALDDQAFEALEGVEIWIVDALRYRPHPTHINVAGALEWIARVKPRHAILTHMHIDLDYRTLKSELPPGVEPAYDGMVLEA